MTASALMPTYARLPVAFSHGDGARLHGTDGRTYLDALSGIAVCGLGHAHPGVTAAIAEQAGRLLHTSNLYEVPLQEELAGRLCALSGMDRVFFGNSGAEANEAAIKLARLHGHRRGIAVPRIVVMERAFHGRTLAALSATGKASARDGFGPPVEGFVRVPFGDLDAVRRLAETDPDVAAVFVEPIQGEGGVRVPAADYLRGLRALCDRQGWLLMLDEVQTGNGRTGRFFAYQHTDVLPDVVTTAKGLANGVPIGACLVRGPASELFGPGSHGSTFGGNPLASRAALAVLDALEGGLMARAGALGERILSGLRDGLAGHNGVREVRGLGLMIGVELVEDAPGLVAEALERGVLLNVTQGNVVRLLPPFVLTDAEADHVTHTVIDLVTARA